MILYAEENEGKKRVCVYIYNLKENMQILRIMKLIPPWAT